MGAATPRISRPILPSGIRIRCIVVVGQWMNCSSSLPAEPIGSGPAVTPMGRQICCWFLCGNRDDIVMSANGLEYAVHRAAALLRIQRNCAGRLYQVTGAARQE
jgi:hypothetical protein